MTTSNRATIRLILNLLPDPPDGYKGYRVEEFNKRYFAIWLLHRDYDYKQGVKTIHSFVSLRGDVHAPLHGKPSNTIVCRLNELYKCNPYTTIKTKPNPLLKYL